MYCIYVWVCLCISLLYLWLCILILHNEHGIYDCYFIVFCILYNSSLSLPLSIPFILTLLYIYLIDIESLIAPALEKIHLCFIVFKPYLCIHATHTHSHTLPNNLNTHTYKKKHEEELSKFISKINISFNI